MQEGEESAGVADGLLELDDRLFGAASVVGQLVVDLVCVNGMSGVCGAHAMIDRSWSDEDEDMDRPWDVYQTRISEAVDVVEG